MRRIALAALLMAGSTASAQVNLRGPGPSEVARAFLDAVTAERWLDAAQMVDLIPLEQVRQQTLRMVRRPQRVFPTITVEDLMRMDTLMPRAVAEYQVAQMRQVQQSTKRDVFSYDFARIKDSTEFKQLSLAELGARWLEAQDERNRSRTAMAIGPSQGCTKEMLAAMTPVPKYAIIGAVELADTAYVLYRDKQFEPVNDDLLGGPPSITLQRGSTGWQIRYSRLLLRRAGGGAFAVKCEPIGIRDSTQRRPPL